MKELTIGLQALVAASVFFVWVVRAPKRPDPEGVVLQF